MDARRKDLFLNLLEGGVFERQQWCDTVVMVADLEEFGQAWLTDVKTYDDDLLVEECVAHRQVGRIKGLSFSRRRRREEDHLLSFSQHEVEVGTHRTENLFHLVVLVLVHHDIGLCLGCVAGDRHVGDDGELGDFLHILVSLNLITENLADEEEEGWDEQTN